MFECKYYNMQNKAQDINAEDFDNVVINSQIPTLVDFWAPWCGPCRAMAPILDTVAQKSEGRFNVAKVDVEHTANHALAMQYEIRSIPNMKLFKNGIVVHEFVGMVDADTLRNAINRALDI